MNFNIPSFANDYNFVICYKEDSSQDTWEYYSVADTMNEAQIDINFLRQNYSDYLVIINIGKYEKGE
jgi:hypothetical protein